MVGQACVLYGAAKYSRDLDLAVLATDDALLRLADALQALQATVIAVPSFEPDYLTRGHAVHFSVPSDADLGPVPPLRVDIMSLMRGVAPFEELFERRTTIALTDLSSCDEIVVDLMLNEYTRPPHHCAVRSLPPRSRHPRRSPLLPSSPRLK